MKKIVFLSFLSSFLMAQISNDLYRECSEGKSKSCYEIGIKQLDLTSPDYDPSLGRDKLNMACNGLYAPACFQYARYFEKSGDIELSRSYYKKSCDLGHSMGCYHYNKGKK